MIKDFIIRTLSNSYLFNKYILDANNYIDFTKSTKYSNDNKKYEWLLNLKRFKHLPLNFRKSILNKYYYKMKNNVQMKTLLEYILEQPIVEMALDRNAFKTKIDNNIIQIIENYVLVYYCHHINKECTTVNYLEQELLTQIKNTTAYTIKISNRKKAVEEILFGQRDLNQFGQIRWYITDKLEEENIDNGTIDELSNVILNNIDEIIEILCTNYNKQNIIEFIKNI